jgi:hypothetical protein
MMDIGLGRREMLMRTLATLAASPLLVEAAHLVDTTKPDKDTDPQAQAFWRSLARTGRFGIGPDAPSVDQPVRNTTGSPVMTDPGRAPIFFFAADPSNSSTWVRANEVDQSKLLGPSSNNPKNDANLQIRVAGVKLSNSDQSSFGKIENGSLRLDVGQAQSFGPTVGNLVWTAIASIWPSVAGKLPATQNVNFDPGTTWGGVSKTPLPGGGGALLWNFFVNKKPTVFSKIISTLQGSLPSTAVVLPLLGLPGYVLSAFAAFNKILGALPQTPTFLFQQAEWQEVVCTQSSLTSNILSAEGAVRLVKGGQYIVVPTVQADSFLTEVKAQAYSLALGRIVKPSDQVPETAALKYLTDVTYATFAVDVGPGLS